MRIFKCPRYNSAGVQHIQHSTCVQVCAHFYIHPYVKTDAFTHVLYLFKGVHSGVGRDSNRDFSHFTVRILSRHVTPMFL